MHTVEAASEKRLDKVAGRIRKELQAAPPEQQGSTLAQGIDELRYNVERDSQAIGSALQLVRHEEAGTQEIAAGTCARLTERLKRHLSWTEEQLQQFVELVSSRAATVARAKSE